MHPCSRPWQAYHQHRPSDRHEPGSDALARGTQHKAKRQAHAMQPPLTAVHKAHAVPLGHQAPRALRHLPQEGAILVGRACSSGA